MEEYISDNSLYIRSKNNSMINRKMIGRVLGMLLFIELGMFLLCAGVSAGYGKVIINTFFTPVSSMLW